MSGFFHEDALFSFAIKQNDVDSAASANSKFISSFPGKSVETTVLRSCPPPAVPHFTGREDECAAIIDQLATQNTKLASVCGSPGFGKTSVAKEVGRTLDSQGHTVLFVSLLKVTTVNEVARHIMAPQPSAQRNLEQMNPVEKLLEWISSVSHPTFLFLDNIDDVLEADKDGFVGFLERVVSTSKAIKVLCTSRESMKYIIALDAYAIRIRHLSNSATDDLIRSLKPETTDTQRRKIGQICGNVPLAIRLLCASVLSDADFIEILEELDSSSTSVLDATDSSDCPEQHHLKRLFEGFFNKLPSTEQEAFVSLSVFSGSFDKDAACAVMNVKGKLATQKILGVLERKALIERDANGSSHSIHPLLHQFGEAIGTTKMSGVYNDANSRFCAHYLHLFEELNGHFLNGRSAWAYQEFQKQEHNIVQTLEGASREAMSAMSQADMFLGSVYWSSAEAYDELFDKAITAAEQQREVVLHSSLLVAKAFGTLAHGNGRSAGLLSKALQVLESIDAIPSELEGRLKCYQGINQVVRGDTEKGILFLKGGLLNLGRMATASSAEFLAWRILRICSKGNCDELQISDDAMRFKVHNHIPSFEKGETGDANAVETDLAFVLSSMYLFGSVYQAVEGAVPRCWLGDFLANHFDDMENEKNSSLNDLYFDGISILCHLGDYSKARQALEKMVTRQNALLGELQNTTGEIRPNTERYREDTNVTPRGPGASSTLKNSDEETLRKARELYRIGDLYLKLGDIRASQRYYRKALEIQRELFNDHVDTAQSLYSLGFTQHQLGDYQAALESKKEAVAIQKKLFGEHVNTAKYLQSFGVTQHNIGDYQAAQESMKEAVAIRRKLLSEHVDTAQSLHSLGVTQHNSGDLQAALDSKKEAVAIQKKLFGEHVNTAKYLQSLGVTQQNIGDYKAARESKKEALAIRRKLLGEHVETAESLESLGLTQHSIGDYQAAQESEKEALAIRRKLLGEHVQTAKSLYSLGVTQHSIGDYQAAQESEKEALAIRRKLLGEHVETAKSLQSLGVTQHSIGDYQAAQESKKEALAIRRKLLGEHVETAESLESLGVTQHSIGDYQAAQESEKEALAIRRKLLGEHVETAKSLQSLGVTQHSIGDYQAAQESEKEALAIRRKLLGEHVETAKSLQSLGVTQHSIGDYQAAQESKKEALAIRRKLLGEHVETAESLESLGVTQHSIGDYQAAQESEKEALAIRRKLLGEHVETAKSLQSLGVTQHSIGDYQAAQESEKEALAIRRKLLGEHVETAKSLQSLGVTQHSIGDYQAAQESKKEALAIRRKLLGEHVETAESFARCDTTQHRWLPSCTGVVAIRRKLLGEHVETAVARCDTTQHRWLPSCTGVEERSPSN